MSQKCNWYLHTDPFKVSLWKEIFPTVPQKHNKSMTKHSDGTDKRSLMMILSTEGPNCNMNSTWSSFIT